MLKLNFPAGTLLQNRFLDNRPRPPLTWTPALSCQIVDDVSLNFGSENSITRTPWSTITREPASKLTNREGVHSNNAQRVVLGAAEILLLEKHFGFHINFFPLIWDTAIYPACCSWNLLFAQQTNKPTATTARSGRWELEQRERAREHYRMQIYSMHIYFSISGSPNKLFISIVIHPLLIHYIIPILSNREILDLF